MAKKPTGQPAKKVEPLLPATLFTNPDALNELAASARSRIDVIEAVKGPDFIYVLAIKEIERAAKILLELHGNRGHFGLEEEQL